eukprot:GILI01007448.1.p1 GENE.GILI01007448.1~~GILI01007448.1.p1  ORF type:complete len:598 (-),score=181.51 GILI01007448.1:158-1951(-)
MTSMRSGNSYFLPSPSLAPPSATVNHRTKFILVTGGVCSSLGKGVTTSTVGALLKSQGYRVSSIKIDPYINVDAGLMSPFEHGEVYVLGDGGEVDLDLGNYERWMGISLTRDHNITTGKVYQTLITREREGKYLGKTVTLVPHFTNEVVEHIERVAALPVDGTGLKPHVCMIELGGTIGDFESAPFVEALRTLRFTLAPEDFCLVHCTYLPVMGGSQKTKPTQHSCRNLLSLGLSADFLVCRSESPVEPSTRDKLSQLCGIKSKYILDAHNVACLYDIPGSFSEQQIVQKLAHKLRLRESFGEVMPPLNFPEPQQWAVFAKSLTNPSKTIKIAFVGKYLQQGSDAYFSVMQTFEHCCLTLNVGLEFLWIDSELLEGADAEATTAAIKTCDGIFVPGGFGKRGTNGKIKAAQIARESGIPYFGVCLGMQIALIEIARNVLGLKDANSEEMDDKTPNRVVMFMPEVDRRTMGATMRLGSRICHITDQDGTSIMKKIYGGASSVRERHRHRYEFNMQHFEDFKAAGVRFTGSSDPNFSAEDTRIEAMELPNHPFFLAVQYHPEFITTPFDPSPPYLAFVAAAGKVAHNWSGSPCSRVAKN